MNGAEDLREDPDRLVDLDEDDLPVLPDQTRDDTDEGWGSHTEDREVRYEQPPHYE